MKPQIREAVAYWESRRSFYNVTLLAVAVAWVALTWPHLLPALTLLNLGRVLALALVANVCYSAAYLVELALSDAGSWRRRRWVLWFAGTLVSVVLACYWIADEIYPFVNQ